VFYAFFVVNYFIRINIGEKNEFETCADNAGDCGLRAFCVRCHRLAGICIPLRGMPLTWFWIDFAFAPAAALPLWIALRDICKAEKEKLLDVKSEM